MLGLGGQELLIILVILMLLFGATKLPKLARSLGQASQEFRRGVKEGDPELVVKSAETATSTSTD